MSDVLVVSIVTGSFAFLSAVFTGIMAFLSAKVLAGQKKAAEKVAEVASDLKASSSDSNTKLDGLIAQSADQTKVMDATHTLVNNAMAAQLRLNKAVTRRLANMTGDPIDIEAADVAEIAYDEHQKKQQVVDAVDKVSS